MINTLRNIVVVALLAAPASAGAVTLQTPGERISAQILSTWKTGLSDEAMRETAQAIVRESEKNGIDPFVVLGLIRVESSGWNKARSVVGARGLMQIRPFVGKALAAEIGLAWTDADTLHDPVANVTLGVHYLGQLEKRYGNLEDALIAYSMGPTKLDKFRKAGKSATREYAITVGWFAKRYREAAACGDLEPGLSRIAVEVRRMEHEIQGRPAVAFAKATGKSPARWGVKVSRTLELNRADFSQLLTAHESMTPAAAKAIVDFRRANGAFRSVDAIRLVPGVDHTLVDALRPFLVVRREDSV